MYDLQTAQWPMVRGNGIGRHLSFYCSRIIIKRQAVRMARQLRANVTRYLRFWTFIIWTWWQCLRRRLLKTLVTTTQNLMDIFTPPPNTHRTIPSRWYRWICVIGSSFSILLRILTLYFTLIVHNLNPIWTLLITTNLLNLNLYLLLIWCIFFLYSYI